jgi:hypothetical protein
MRPLKSLSIVMTRERTSYKFIRYGRTRRRRGLTIERKVSSFPIIKISRINYTKWSSTNGINGKRLGEAIECWESREDVSLKNCPHQKDNTKNAHNIQEATIIDDVARTIHRIYATLEYHQVYHQLSLVEDECKIMKQSIFTLIHVRSSHNYVTTKVVKSCALNNCKHSKSWIV